jgi:alpha 1,2-mannosyltransferase
MLASRSHFKVISIAIFAVLVLYVGFQWHHVPAWRSSIPNTFAGDKTSAAEEASVEAPVDEPVQSPVHDYSSYNDTAPVQEVSVHNISAPVEEHSSHNTSAQLEEVSVHNSSTSVEDTRVEFWRSFQSLLASNKPDCPPPKRLGSSGAIGFNPTDGPARPDLLEMPNEDLEKMRNAHSDLVQRLNTDPPKMVYTPGTRGIVSTAGGSYLPILVISLRMLRRTGSKLPMEVFLADKTEYESYICETVLPDLNAKCVVLSDILDKVPKSVSITHYQYKVVSMLFSSFEELLFLDSDAFPIHEPMELFAAEPFASHGLVLWPDYWASTASPLFYNITSQPTPSTTLRQSSETGEILISKKGHQRSLLLATYYNYYGPDVYYALLSQGSPGEGDKETFLAAASVFNETVYQVSESVRAIGHFKADGDLAGSAMVQYDPVEDYRLTQQGLWRVKNSSVAEPPGPFFVHANFPRFNPATIFAKIDVITDGNGKYQRAWTDTQETIKTFGYDVERGFWEEITWVACELEDKFADWSGKHGICQHAKDYSEAVFGGP